MTTGTCYLQYYIEYILAAQKRYAPAGRKLPLCIMTSNDTNDATVALLERNNYYGMDPSQVTIVQQGQGVPALMDNQARMAHVSKSEWFTLQTKPHGHGDIHILMHSNGVAQQWLNTGFKWMILFQDTNGLAFHSLPLMLGVSKRLGFVMNSMAVPRKAKQAVGGIALLTKTSTGEKRYVVCVACPYYTASACWDDVKEFTTSHPINLSIFCLTETFLLSIAITCYMCIEFPLIAMVGSQSIFLLSQNHQCRVQPIGPHVACVRF